MRYCRFIVLLFSVVCLPVARAQGPDQTGNGELARSLNVSFAPGSSSVMYLERDGKRYVIDVAAKSIREASQSEPSAPASQSGGSGGALFQANCSGCHGADGKGISSRGTPDFTNSSMHSTLNTAHIEDTVRRGKDGRMPSFAGRLSDDQIGEIATWVNNLSAGPVGSLAPPLAKVFTNPVTMCSSAFPPAAPPTATESTLTSHTVSPSTPPSRALAGAANCSVSTISPSRPWACATASPTGCLAAS